MEYISLMLLGVDFLLLIISMSCLRDIFKYKKKMNDDLKELYKLLLKAKEKKRNDIFKNNNNMSNNNSNINTNRNSVRNGVHHL